MGARWKFDDLAMNPSGALNIPFTHPEQSPGFGRVLS
jgi:hypothetical protein